ncbi:MAG: DsbA family protein [Pseudomonadota bacterium]
MVSIGFAPLAARAGAALLLLGLAACGGASSEDGSAATANDALVDPAPEGTGALGDMTLGNPESGVTLIEYASYTCPACKSFHDAFFKEIKTRYIDTGKINFIFREFPTGPVDRSAAASLLARCAADKNGTDAYFLVQEALFATQEQWSRESDWQAQLMSIAAQARIDETAFFECVQRQDLADLINQNVTNARNTYNVSGTPTIILNGETLRLTSAADLYAAIDAAIAETTVETDAETDAVTDAETVAESAGALVEDVADAAGDEGTEDIAEGAIDAVIEETAEEATNEAIDETIDDTVDDTIDDIVDGAIEKAAE